MSNHFGRVLLMIIFIIILFNYIKKDDYLSIGGLLIITLFIDRKMNQKKSIEFFGQCSGTKEENGEDCSTDFDTSSYNSADEALEACNNMSGCNFISDPDVEQEQIEEEPPDVEEDEPVEENKNVEEDEQVEENEPVEEDDDEGTSNNAVDGSEDNTNKEKILDENVNRDKLPSSKKEDFNQTKDINVMDNKFRVGPYDSLCLTSDKYKDPGYVQNDVLKTYFGVQGPVQVVSSPTSENIGPTIDGDKDSPQKLSILSNNKTSFNCCHESPYMSSTGCVCLTDKQREYIRSRGFNNIGSSSNL